MRAALIIVLCCFAGVAAAGAPKEDLDKARDAFRKRDCDAATGPLTKLLYPFERLADRDSLFEARAMLGACFADAGQREQAKAEFEKALQLKPREVLDSLFYSERAVRLFDDTKADIENRAKKDAELRELQAQRERIEQAIKNLRVYRSSTFALNFAPFGLGQLQNGQRLKAGLFAGGQIATLGTSAGVFYYLVRKYGISSDRVPLDEGPRVRRLQQIEIATGVAFWGLYVWSVLDALYYYEPQRRVAGDDDLLREIQHQEIDKQKNKQKSSFFDKLQLSPMITPDSVGIGITWED